jgi:hypothetical protein
VRRLLVAAVGLAILFGGCAGGGDEPAPPPGRFLSTQETLTPQAHLFGDPVEARLDVVVDRRRLDPGAIRVRAGFLPYRMVDGLRRSRRDFSRFTRLRFEATLRCLTVQCVPTRLGSVLGDQEGRGERRTFRFDHVRVLYDDPRTGETRELRRAVWPPLDSISRLSPEREDPFAFRFMPGAEFEATLAPVLEPEYAVHPWLMAALLLAGAAALLALPGRHVARWALARRREAAVAAAEVPPLELALRRVEHARDHGDPDEQRDALEALAVLLDGNGSGPTRGLRELAWSVEPPPAERMTAVVATVREADGASL